MIKILLAKPQNPKYRIYAVMDIDEQVAAQTAIDTGAAYWAADVNKLLSDKQIDVVFITTRHDSHAELTIQSANAGKHILCEKPMGLNREECRRIAEAVKRNNVKYTVGYNRGMAPMVTKARDLIKCCGGYKKMIYHRIQAPFAESHWTHQPEIGGGRFVGEGCHIFDLMCEIVNQPPITVYASGGTFLNPDLVKIPDSGIVTITFADGSVGTTLINSAGCSDFPRQISEWCRENGLILTGHLSGEESTLTNMTQSGNFFKSLSCYHIPGIDSIFSKQQISHDGFNIAGCLASSVAKYMGSDRVLCEAYSGSG